MDLIAPIALGDYPCPTRSMPLTVSDVIEKALVRERRGLHGHDQREQDRYPYTRLVELTPWDLTAKQPLGEAIMVAGRNLSLNGLGFYNRSPLEARYVMVQLYPGTDYPGLIMKLIWCRFVCPEWYDNGGRFIRIATTAA